MRPLLRDGDLVHVRPLALLSPADLKPGMLLLFERDGQPIVHRFVGRRGALLLEQGDRLPRANPLDPAALLGRVVARKRDGRVAPLRRSWWWVLRGLVKWPGGKG